MTGRTWDADGEASSALRTILADYGEVGLSSEQLMTSVLTDLMPETPREASVLVYAAKTDLAGALRQRSDQGLSPQAVVAQVAALLEDRTGLAADACTWAARAIGAAIGVVPESGAGTAPAAAGAVPAAGGAVPAGAQPPTVVPDADGGPAGASSAAETPGHVDAGRRRVPTVPDAVAGLGVVAIASWGSLLAAVLLPVYVEVAPYSQGMPWSFMLALIGVSLTLASVLSLARPTRQLGLGAIFGAAVVTAASLAELASLSAPGEPFRGRLLVAELLLVVMAAVAAAAAVSALRALRPGRARAGQLGVLLCAAAACFGLSAIPSHDEFLAGGRWYAAYHLFGLGYTGWEDITGVLYIALLAAPLVAATWFLRDLRARAGAWAGWLAVSPAFLVALNLTILDTLLPPFRVTAWMYVSWGLWLTALVAGAAMLTRQRADRLVPAVTSTA
jgi:hypothetical protein